MKRKLRSSIPARIADTVMYQADLLCCVCESRGQHIHHIDSNPSNHAIDNLVLLCFRHHDEVSTRGGLQRRLTPGLLRKYREALYRKIGAKRQSLRDSAALQKSSLRSEELFQLMLDAVAIRHIESLQNTVTPEDLDTVQRLLGHLSAFVTASGPHARKAILEQLSDLAYGGRFRGRSTRLACFVRSLCRITYEAIPISTVRAKMRGRLFKAEYELIEYGLAIGGQLAYDGALYGDNLAVVDAGAELLWKILRFARINGLDRLRTAAATEFETAMDAARRAGNPDAQAVIQMYRSHGEHGDWHYPRYPRDLGEKVFEAEREANSG